MPARFGGTPIGGMQYNGVTIGEAMIDGQIVYRLDTGPVWVPYYSPITGPGLSPTVMFFVPPGLHRLVVRYPDINVRAQFLQGSTPIAIVYGSDGTQASATSEVVSSGEDYGLRFIVQPGIGPFDAEYMVEPI